MKKHILPLLLITILFACKKDDINNYNSNTATLHFSTDTITFDTVFASIGSITKTLTVYNKNNFELNKIFKKIYQLKYPRLLVEGGKKLTNSIISKSLADEFYLFKSDNKLKNNGRINVNNILKKINTFSKNKRSILVNLDKEKLINYNFY